MTQRDPMWRMKPEVRLDEDEDYRYTAATDHPDSTVFRIAKADGRRKILGPRSKTRWKEQR